MRARLSVIVSAACFATLGVLASAAYHGGATPLSLLTWRFVAAAVLMAGYQALKAPASLVVGRSDIARFAVLSATGYGAASLCFFFGVQVAGAAVTTVLLYTYPAIVALIGWVFLKERLVPTRAAAIAVTFAGCALVAAPAPGENVRIAGVLLGLGAGAGYAAFTVLSHRWMDRRPRTVLMAYMFGFSAVIACGAALATGTSLSVRGWTPVAWWALGTLVLVPTFAAVLLYLHGMSEMGASRAALLSSLEPVFAIALASWLLGERLMPVQYAGCALVVAGVVLAEWVPRRGPVEGPAGV